MKSLVAKIRMEDVVVIGVAALMTVAASGVIVGCAVEAETPADIVLGTPVEASVETPGKVPVEVEAFSMSGLPFAKEGLVVDGVRLTLTSAPVDLKEGDRPTATLRAVNESEGPVALTASVELMTMGLGSALSRSPMPFKEAWSTDCAVSLNAGETQTYELAPDVALNMGTSGAFHIRVGDDGAAFANFSVPLELPEAPLELLESMQS